MSDQPIIGIDASRAVGRTRTGTENYSWQLIRRLVQFRDRNTWRLYINGGGNQLPPLPVDVDVRDIPSRRLWTHGRLSRELLRHNVAGLFVPAHVVPLYHPPTVVTIHDLGYLHWPETHPARDVRMLDWTTRWSAKVARHIIVPSRQTAHDLEEHYGVAPQKITVIHHGVSDAMSPTPDDSDITLRQRYGLPDQFVLAVGTVQPRKNLPTLARAMALSPKLADLHLMIAGRPGWMYEDVLQDIQSSGLGSRLHMLNYVPDDDLPALYRAASLFVQPSRFEGFGMPVLEAMACGTPVVAARGSSLDEIGGEVAIRFSADDPDELAAQIEDLLGNPVKADAARMAGLAWSAAFTWEQTAEKTRIVLEENLLLS